ncbi:627_t:CDS:1 [Racocetra persica]|uniref:627_t:CDS:1 n=1 Tax=Racocetra persica TaxID=160502 RepID=A0ACA9PMG1_9GLOM|nr:627_t:CDS:1 [Racocetra persica]
MSQRIRIKDVPVFTPFPQTNIHFPDESLVNKIIGSIDSAVLLKIKQHVYLEIKDLIAPRPKKNRNRQKIPRPQNPFVIFRRNAQAKMEASLETEMKESMLTLVSKTAGEDWKKANAEVKSVFNYLATLAKKVHEKTYPDYVYKPRKKANSPIPELQSFQDDSDSSSYTNNYSSIHTSPNEKNHGVWVDSQIFPYALLPSKHLPSICSLIDSISENTLATTILPCSPTYTCLKSPDKQLNYKSEISSVFKSSIRLPSPDVSNSYHALPPLEVDISNYTTHNYDRNLLTALSF